MIAPAALLEKQTLQVSIAIKQLWNLWHHKGGMRVDSLQGGSIKYYVK